MVFPDKLSKLQDTWHIYPLEQAFKAAVFEKVGGPVPRIAAVSA
jgi:hypothetical protein